MVNRHNIYSFKYRIITSIYIFLQVYFPPFVQISEELLPTDRVSQVGKWTGAKRVDWDAGCREVRVEERLYEEDEQRQMGGRE